MRRHLIVLALMLPLLLPAQGSADPGGVRRPCRAASTVGTMGDDIILGTDGRDFIRGGKGNDLLIGLGGNDRLCGQDGRDRIIGGSGIDQGWGGLSTDACVDMEQVHACRVEG